LKKKQEELEEIGAGFPNPLSLGIRWREKRVLSVLCYVLEPDWALCSSRHGRCDIDPRDKGDIWVAMTRTLRTRGWDVPSSPGDARLGACGRQSPLLLLPSCFTANLPLPWPLLPNKPLSSRSCFLGRYKYHHAFFCFVFFPNAPEGKLGI